VELAEKIELMDERSIPRSDVAHVLAASLEIDNAKNKVMELLSGDKEIELALKML